MKKFLKTVLAVICGVLILNLLGFGLLCLIGGGLGNTKPVIPTTGVLKIDLSKVIIAEQSKESLNFNLGSEQIETIGLRQATQAIRAAAEDPGVKYIYLKPEGATIGTASMVEFRKALSDFRKSGKPIVSYMENPSTGSYYLASVADAVYVTAYQGGTPMLTGISSQQIFLKDLLDRLGIKVQLIRHGKYKSAGERYVRSSSSEENRRQTQAFVDAIWEAISGEIAQSRGITTDELNSLIDNLSLCLPADFVEYGLADATLTRQELAGKLAVLAGVDSYDKVPMIPFAAYSKTHQKNNFRALNKIAIIYADGQIQDGNALTDISGDRFASIIETVRKDSTVKAVVLRVNSPGGSVVASEKIKTELDLLGEDKLLVASYGDYAASGGYWISNNAEKIYCSPTTITGSIGVFGMVPEFSGLIEDIAHIGVEAVSSNRHADMYSLTRPFTEEETAYVQRSIESIYTKFIGIVADGRSMTPQQVDEIAQGRVWAGSDALEIGLVDEMGTLEDALHYAATAAGDSNLDNWNVVEYPKPLTVAEELAALFSNTEENDFSIYTRWYDNWKKGKVEVAFADMPYRLVIR